MLVLLIEEDDIIEERPPLLRPAPGLDRFLHDEEEKVDAMVI